MKLKIKKIQFHYPKIKFEKFSERLSAQIMHIGPYGAAEVPTVEKLHDFIEKSGYKIRR